MLHLTDGDTEAQGGKVTCSSSHIQIWGELGLGAWSPGSSLNSGLEEGTVCAVQRPLGETHWDIWAMS